MASSRRCKAIFFGKALCPTGTGKFGVARTVVVQSWWTKPGQPLVCRIDHVKTRAPSRHEKGSGIAAGERPSIHIPFEFTTFNRLEIAKQSTQTICRSVTKRFVFCLFSLRPSTFELSPGGVGLFFWGVFCGRPPGMLMQRKMCGLFSCCEVSPLRCDCVGFASYCCCWRRWYVRFDCHPITAGSTAFCRDPPSPLRCPTERVLYPKVSFAPFFFGEMCKGLRPPSVTRCKDGRLPNTRSHDRPLCTASRPLPLHVSLIRRTTISKAQSPLLYARRHRRRLSRPA